MVKYLKLTVLNDNEPGKDLKNDWGWSVFLESERWNILFDADTDPNIIEYNSKKLNVPLEKLDFAFLSHYHGDHYGGFSYVGKVAPGLKIYVPDKIYEFLIDWNMNPIPISKGFEITEGVWSSGPMGFIREHALGINVENLGVIVIVGCSHPGVDKLAKKLSEIMNMPIYAVIGGFHTPSRRTVDNLASIAKFIAPAHCSGSRAKIYVKERFPEKYIEVHTGSVLSFGKV